MLVQTGVVGSTAAVTRIQLTLRHNVLPNLTPAATLCCVHCPVCCVPQRVPLVSKSQELVQQLQHLLGYQVTQDAATAGAATTHDNISSMPEASAASSSPVPAAQTGTIADAVMRDAEECDDRQQAPNLQQQQQQCSGSSDSSGSLQCLRRLSGLRLGDVSSPEHLDALLQQLSVCTTQLWEVSR
jgi:hypothetical protein